MTERKCAWCDAKATMNVNHYRVCEEHVVDAMLVGS